MENLFGISVSDPYRWLEDGNDARVRDWAAAQDGLFRAYRAGWHEKQLWASLVDQVSSFGVSEPPTVRGSVMFLAEQLRGDEQRRLLVVDAEGNRRVLVDPVEIDPSGHTGLYAWWPSREGERVAVQMEVAEQPGSDIVVLDVRTGKPVDGPLPRARNTSLAWLPGGDAFYYVSRVPDEELASGDMRLQRRVRLHRIGSPWQADAVVFGGDDAPDHYYGLTVSADGRYLAITAMVGPASHNDVYVAELIDPKAPHFVKIVDGQTVRARVLPRFLADNDLLLVTDHQAPCGRICVAHRHDTDPAAWRTLVAEDPEAPLDECLVLDDPALSRPLLLVARARHGTSTLTLHDLASGRPLTGLPLPGAGIVSSLRSNIPHGRHAWFSYCDATTPPTIYRYDATSGQMEQETGATTAGHAPEIRSHSVRYQAADGTEITLFLFTPAEEHQGPRPTILYGYGSFGMPMRPWFFPMAAAWVSAGGTYAVACVRGGGEEGQHWHDAGRGPHKHRAVSDFNDAAAWLIDTGRTTRDQLAIFGQSAGGLLVTAAATKRPDLYAAVIAEGPLCDMVRYEHFGLGCTWTEEFGTASQPEQLQWLLTYSPYHNITPGAPYPAFLLTGAVTDLQTGEAHVTKMCAALQHATSGDRPILMRREPDTAHAASPASKERALSADILAFAGKYTGLSLRKTTMSLHETAVEPH
ncbi:prolyl oligopeptidase family serine peptidase [Planotetraspora sp. A-T 1434]|uniref:prolyl oligopeptidase family serine peptidase n=1 Tax=Planotetraspora sp. A-T 1434 TaxID=2979219 RepID=UPI0021BFF6B4|nr:prolyl oligopeptidase family serine peptidase [Planotetraspora sp. A-T 1434]MCT9934125.1 prolyl oligopeptidase family serine peptidase [Planotetraspora sp. A-T 1434]